MSGNVWEMTDDIIDDNYKIICGGAFNSSENELRLDQCFDKMGRSRESRDDVGFRLVCDESEMERLKKAHPEHFIF